MARDKNMAWHFDAASHIGARTEQQDRVEILTAADGSARLAVLADGLGGQQDGAAAAQAVIDIARRRFIGRRVDDPEAFLHDLCRDAHAAVTRLGQRRRTNPASTCVLLYVRGAEAYWAHVGDSRLYHFRGAELLSRTRDHTVAEVRSAAGGEPSGAVAQGRPDNRLYMCLGGRNDLIPESGASAVGDDDWFLLCSDGFWSQIGPEEAARAYREPGGEATTADALARLATHRAGPRSDNVSLVLATHRPGDGTASRHPSLARLWSSVRARWAG